MAEWLGKGLQNPVPRFDSGCRLSEGRETVHDYYGRLAQGESASLTRKRSVVRIHYRPLSKYPDLQEECRVSGEDTERGHALCAATVQQPEEVYIKLG